MTEELTLSLAKGRLFQVEYAIEAVKVETW